jgi:hypothetical protein
MLVLWALSAPGFFLSLACLATAKESRWSTGAWGGCLAALGMVGLMAYQFFFAGGRRDAQGAIMLITGPLFAWMAGLAVACSIWLGGWLWQVLGRGQKKALR